VVDRLLKLLSGEIGNEVEIEFAATFPPGAPARFGLLQVRPMAVSDQVVEITEDELAGSDLLLSSDRVMGNGMTDTITDIVYVKPDTFAARHTPAIVPELERLNRDLVASGRPYLLIGFGRWGSTDSWLGIPVVWGQIAGARVIVEATLPEMNVEPSQGSHFFHNITSFQVSYFSVHHAHLHGIDWDWLGRQDPVVETAFLRQLRLPEPLLVKVDRRSGRGAIWHGGGIRRRREPGPGKASAPEDKE
jgi:hypothetical protein